MKHEFRDRERLCAVFVKRQREEKYGNPTAETQLDGGTGRTFTCSNCSWSGFEQHVHPERNRDPVRCDPRSGSRYSTTVWRLGSHTDERQPARSDDLTLLRPHYPRSGQPNAGSARGDSQRNRALHRSNARAGNASGAATDPRALRQGRGIR